MDKHQLTEQGFSFFNIEGVRSAVESAANSPKVAAGVAAGTAGMGAMAKLDIIQSALGTFSLFIGAITGCLVMAIQAIKMVRVWRSWTPNKPDAQE